MQPGDFNYALRKLLVLMMLSDGKIRLEEIQEIKTVIRQLTGKEASDLDVQEVVDTIEQGEQSVEDYLLNIAQTTDAQEKQILMRAAVLMSSSDGELSEEEKTMLHRYAEAFGLSNSDLGALIEKHASGA